MKNQYQKYKCETSNIWNSYWYEIHPTVCVYIYGQHEESVSQKWTNSALDLLQVHWWYIYFFDGQWKRTWWFLELPYNFHPNLKLVSAIFLFFQFFFHQMIVLKKLWKMFFISSKKLFSFSRYSNFCIFSASFPLFPDSVR